MKSNSTTNREKIAVYTFVCCETTTQHSDFIINFNATFEKNSALY